MLANVHAPTTNRTLALLGYDRVALERCQMTDFPAIGETPARYARGSQTSLGGSARRVSQQGQPVPIAICNTNNVDQAG